MRGSKAKLTGGPLVDVQWSADVAQADWIGPRLAPFEEGCVTSVVPGGFAAYARLLHPASGEGDRPVRWSEVASRAGTTMRRDGFFAEIALLPPDHAGRGVTPWARAPNDTRLHPSDATALVELLRTHAGRAQDCWFCLWDGFGWESSSQGSMVLDDSASGDRATHIGPSQALDTPEESPVPQEVLDGPRVQLPNRDYLLYEGEAHEALAFAESEQVTPNLWWPADRTWCVGSEIYTDWTFVGGSVELVDQLAEDPRLEAHRIEPDDRPRLELPMWLADGIETAVQQVRAGSPAVVATNYGTTTTTLRLPTRLRDGELETTHLGVDGSHEGSATSYLPAGSGQPDDDDVRHQITHALIDMLA